ncbi:hypothetical protein C1646_762510 [Rhizophagus diaphanus]|nr:hypothetical protein C1646_762510 [Rhizophagus diaphanus] [Rhizophagus sp. MUCL 43196]
MRGQPVVLGNVKELGSWNNPIVKLRQPFPQNPTYWKSDPVAISVSNFGEVQYNYAIHTPKFTLFGREGKIIFEGIDVQDRRTLNIKITDQFDIWRIRGFAFVYYIYDSTEGIIFQKEKVLFIGNLYDLWNQNYIGVRNKEKINYFTRVALGAYAYPMFYVSPNFKCIVVMDENNLTSVDPSLLNRFEKQKLSINDMLDDRQKLLVKYLYNWTNQITTLVKANSMTGLHNKFTQEDLFIGFDKDETLQTSPDGILRAELSILDQDEVDRLKYVYFKQHHHNGLSNYFDALFDQEKLSADPKGQLVIINTFSKINMKFKSCLQDYLRCQVYNLSTIKTEFQLTNIVKNFFFESNDKVLILQCDINTVNTKCIKLLKYIIEQFRNEFLAEKEKCESNMFIKYACIIFHIQRDYESSSITSNFICGWKRITIESLETPEIPLIDLLDKSLYDIINSELFDKIVNSTMPFERILEELLLQEHYHSNKSHMDPIRILRKEILNDLHIMKCIKTKTFVWILKNYKNWQCEAALNKKDLSMFTCFSIALQNYVKKIIKHTIYKVLYSIENYRKLKEYSKIKQRLSVVPSEMINDLEFPFSYYFLINYYRRYYFEELDILTQDSENIKELIEDHIGDFRNNLIFIHPNFDNLQKCSELYYDDFIRIILSIYSIKSAGKEKLDFIFRYLIGDKFADDPFILHIYWWKYATEILIQLKLVETFPDLITKAQNDFIVYGKLDHFLFKESINLILQNICEDKPWKQDMDVILSINNYYHNSEDQSQQLIPAKAFVLALKRFIYRYLLSLHTYFLDFTLNLWISNIKEELIKELFPTCLLVSHAYNSYVYLLDEIEKASNERQNNRSFAYTSSTTRKTLIKKYKKFTD